ncbi:unnamed protein product [Urochloa humidicola]
MAKRMTNNLANEPLPKRKKVEPCDKVLIGQSGNLTSRENQIFDTCVKLVTKTKNYPKSTSSNSLLSKAGNALYMEYSTNDENLYLWLKCYTGPEIKFLVHPVYMIESVPAANRPLLAFSENFVDSENWRIIKSVFTQVFGGVVSPSEDDTHDFVFAFSRRGDFVHFRSYKILSVPDSSSLEKRLKLSPPSQHLCFMAVRLPIGGVAVKLPQSLDLSEGSVFIGTSSSNLSLLHSAVLNGTMVHFVLEDVIDLSNWRGFSTTLSDFKKRNVSMFEGKVPGSKGATVNYPNDRYLSVIRGVLLETVGLHKSDMCFTEITQSDVCLSGTKVKLSWKLKLEKYGTLGGRRNFKAIKALILEMFQGKVLPHDLEVLLQLLDSDILISGDYVCTHSSLMDEDGQSHLITDIYVLFSTHLVYRHKLLVAEPFSQRFYKEFEASVESNKYLSAVRDREITGTAGSNANSEVIRLQVEQEEKDAEDEVKLSAKKADGPHDKVTRVTKMITQARHSNVHLSDHYLKKEAYKCKKPARQNVRIIKHSAPGLLPKLQNELRYIVGDKWFAKYFHQ